MSFLASRGVSLNVLTKQFKGRKFGELILHEINQLSINQINDAISYIYQNVHPVLKETTDQFLFKVTFNLAKSDFFWKMDCGEALLLYTNLTKSEAKKFNLEVDDDYAYDIFNLIILSLAKKTYQDPKFKEFIKKSITPRDEKGLSLYLAVIKNYAGFSGRARRKEFWMFILFYIIFGVLAIILDYVLGTVFKEGGGGRFYLFYSLYCLVLFIPLVAVSVRRLHDIGKRGITILITMIPLIGVVWFIWLMVLDSVPGENKYGPNHEGILAS
jgi:uncharacterized membrane protein YhaH (DUF805 family)